MPFTQTNTAIGSALSTATTSAWLPIPKNPGIPIVQIVASSVTSGGVVAIEGRERGVGNSPGDTSPARELHRMTIAANGTSSIPLDAITENAKIPDEVRINFVSRTDGTMTSALLTNTRG